MTAGRERRLVFGEVAEQYDRARPGYPPAVFVDVLSFAGHRAGERVLEVGAGTGKATAGYVAAGARVVALEPSVEMAAVARARFADVDAVEVVGEPFEAWAGDGDDFAVVTAFQAWHWVDAATRLAKARAVLRDAGALALCWNQPRYPDVELRRSLDDAYAELAPGTQGRFAQGVARPLDGQDSAIAELDASSAFTAFEVREYSHEIVYDADAYVDLLETHSDHRMLVASDRTALLDRVADLVRRAGSITVDYGTTLALARRVG